MSYRNTPLECMSAPRYLAWREKRIREMRRERNIRYAAGLAIPFLVFVVALVIAGLYLAWSTT